MSALVLEFSESLRAVIAGEASRRGVSESVWLEEAVREKLAAEAEMAYLAGRGHGPTARPTRGRSTEFPPLRPNRVTSGRGTDGA